MVALVLFAVLCGPASIARLYVVRETYRLAELLGVMDPQGALGGQIMGFNYQREPAWAHWATWCIGTLVAFGPVVLVTLGAATAGVIGTRHTLCGGCGSVLRGLAEPRCPRCGREFG